jgi:hypothetical protein
LVFSALASGQEIHAATVSVQCWMLNPPLNIQRGAAASISSIVHCQNETERKQNAHAAKACQCVATAQVGVSRIRSDSGEYRELSIVHWNVAAARPKLPFDFGTTSAH